VVESTKGARIVPSSADFEQIESGDVLVTRTTSSGYNVLLPLLGAVVTDQGGALCHTAIVAREFGLPAVVGTGDATARIPDGARIVVDGDLLIPLSSHMGIQVYGGKASRLSEALCAGLPVPPGCVLHPDFMARVALGNLTSDERAALEHALAPFKEGDVAVRSSAIAKVWASGQTEAARRYRARMSIAGEPRVAIIVQALVPAEVAGVLFTVDPISGSGDSFMVEASWGLGEAAWSHPIAMSLLAPANCLSVNWVTRIERLSSTKIGALSKWRSMIQCGCRKHAWVNKRLFTQACERLFGAGQDIEWAEACGKLSLLQCRPVTSGGRT
jgi:phosphohistidine swiveling domain-containing protein